MNRFLSALLLFLLLLLSGNGLSADRPKIGLVLSGGGARGAAHVGVLKVIEKLQIPIDYIGGTSMGAIIGGLYASGMSAAEIETVLGEIDWADVLSDDTTRRELSYRRKREDDDFLVRSAIGFNDGELELPMGLLEGQKLTLLLKQLTLPVAGVGDFDRLAIPFRALATDISTGEAVILEGGDLAMAMRASSSIPSVFSTVEIDGRLLVDGGVSDNLPVKVVRDMGAEVLIVVDISTPLTSRDRLTSALAVADQLTTIMTRRNTERSLRLLDPQDVFIVPDLGEITTTSFIRSVEAIPLGERAARKIAERLAGLSVDASAWLAYREGKQRHRRVSGNAVLEFVRINNESRIADEVVAAHLDLETGQPLDQEKLKKAIARLYGMDLFQIVSYRLVEEEGAAGIIIDVREKPWGPNYLQGGLRFQGDWNSGSGFNIGVSYTRTAVNPLGGEFRSIIEVGETQRLFGEFYQPLSVHNPYFINPQLEYRRIPIGFFTEGQEIARYHLTQIRFSLEAGKELGDWGELRFGYQYGWDDVELEIGSPSLEEGSFQEGSLFLQLGVDTLDNLYFPTAGQRAEIRYRGYREVLGGDHDFDQISAFWTGAYSYGKNTLLLHGRLGYMLDDDAPVYGRFLLGGFLNLSGFDRFELSGQHLAHGYVGFMRRLDEDSIVPVYLGGTVEMGNTWERAGDFGDGWFVGGSLYLGLDTYIGPLYIGVAAAEADHQTLFMFLGAPF